MGSFPPFQGVGKNINTFTRSVCFSCELGPLSPYTQTLRLTAVSNRAAHSRSIVQTVKRGASLRGGLVRDCLLEWSRFSSLSQAARPMRRAHCRTPSLLARRAGGRRRRRSRRSRRRSPRALASWASCMCSVPVSPHRGSRAVAVDNNWHQTPSLLRSDERPTTSAGVRNVSVTAVLAVMLLQPSHRAQRRAETRAHHRFGLAQTLIG